MKKLILKWLGLQVSPHTDLIRTIIPDDERGMTVNYRVGLIKTMNNRYILEIGTYTPNQRGPDWTYEFYAVDSDQKLSEAVGIILTMKGLEK